jgi:DNA-binding transcriptional LysR family regulator
VNEDPYDVMDLKALKCFWAMAKNLSLTKAGIELGISEAAVSQRVKSLESRLDTKLYEARGGRVKLTPVGERTMEMAVGLFDSIETFEDALSKKEEAYEITLCTHDSVMSYMLPQVVVDLSRAYPLTKLRLLTRSLDECVQLVRTNESDIAIVSQRDLPKEMAFHLVAKYPGFLVLPRGHPLVRRARADFYSLLNDETIQHYPLIVAEAQAESEHIKNILGRLDLPINIGLEVGNFETLKHYVGRGLGIALVSGLCLTKSDRERFETVEIPADLGGETSYGVILRKDKSMSRPLSTLLQLLGIEQ